MSNGLVLIHAYKNVVGALQRREPVAVALPNGMTVQAVPELVNGPEGQPLIQIHVRTDGASGEIQGIIRMSPETFDKALAKAESMTPKLVVMQQRLALPERR